MLAINDFVDHWAVTLTVTLRQEKCQSRERRPNFERAAILTPKAKAQFESIWAQAPTPPAICADEAGDTSGSLPAGDRRAEAAMGNCAFMGRAPRAFHRTTKRTGGASGGLRSLAGCQNETTVWSLAGMGLQRRDLRQPGWAKCCGRLRDPRVVLSGKTRLSGSREGRKGSGWRRSQVPLVRSGNSSDSSAVPRKRGDRNLWRSSQLRTGLLC